MNEAATDKHLYRKDLQLQLYEKAKMGDSELVIQPKCSSFQGMFLKRESRFLSLIQNDLEVI